MANYSRGSANNRWNGGVKFHDGYVLILSPDHSRADSQGYVREHILVAEKALGKPLPEGVEVHHADLDKANNKNSNLVICPDKEYHEFLHMRLRALREGGNPQAKQCRYCRRWELPGTKGFTVLGRNDRPNAKESYHKACAAKERRK